MVLSLSSNMLKQKSAVLIILIIAFFCVYIYFNNLQQSYRFVQWSEERCVTQLTSIKYQLNVVTEYKNRIDKLLTDTQIAHETEKDRFKDIMDSCVVLKQQTVICQSQYEDLQVECKKVKEDYGNLKRELQKLNKSG